MAEAMMKRSPLSASALLLQLDTYARPSEVLALARQDVLKPSTKHCIY